MNAEPSDDRMGLLMQRYFAHDLNEAETRELQDALRTNPKLQDEMAELMLQWVHLKELAAEEKAAPVAVDITKSSSRRMRSMRKRKANATSWMPIVAAAAAIVCAIVGLFLLSPAPKDDTARKDNVPPVIPAKEQIKVEPVAHAGSFRLADGAPPATLIRGQTRTLISSEQVLLPGDRLETPAGDGVRQVFATVKLASGAEIDLSEDASMMFGSAQHVEFDRGKLYADVAKDFRPDAMRAYKLIIQTPSANVGITGTKFDLRVSSEQTSINMEEGKVTFFNAQGKQTVSMLEGASCKSGRAPDAPAPIALADIWRGRKAPALAEEFSYTTAELPRKWDLYESKGNEGVGIRSKQAVSVEDGMLTITARGDVSGGLSHKFDQLYGRWEVRARVEKGTGYRPSIMLWRASEKSEGAEINLMESFAGDRSKMWASVRYATSLNKPMAGPAPADIDVSQWHTYAVDWTPGVIRIFVDGKAVLETTDVKIIPVSRMHLALQLDIGAEGRQTPPRDATTPAQVKMQIDWIKVYELSK